MKKIISHVLFWVCYYGIFQIINWFFYYKIHFLDSILVATISVGIFYVSVWGLNKSQFSTISQTIKSALIFLLCVLFFTTMVYVYRFILAPRFSLPQIVSKDSKKIILQGLSWFLQYYFYALGYFFLTKSTQKQKQLRIAAEEKAKLVEEKLVFEETNKQLLLANQALEKKQLLTQSAFLRSQINPHFLQNTLNFLYGKTRKHAAELAEGVLLLSDIMRYSLEATKGDDDLTPLREEMQHLNNLIKLQQLRFSNRLYVELSTTGNWQKVKLPPLTLITLAENAFKYGELEEEQHPVTIHLHVTEDERQLQFTVANKKKHGPVEVSYGIGHDNIRNRLSMQYGNNFELSTKNEPDYYTVYLTINLHQ